MADLDRRVRWRSAARGKVCTGSTLGCVLHRPNRLLCASVAATVLLLQACEPAGSRDDAAARLVQVDTLEDGTVHVRNSARGLWRDDDAWRLDEEFRLGQIEGNSPQVFGEIRHIGVDPHDRLYVVDSQVEAIRVFDAAGEYVRTLGRAGEGPGELQLVRGISIDRRGRVWALDGGNFRYTVWDSAGNLVGSRDRPFPYLPSVFESAFAGDRLVEYTGGLFVGQDGRRQHGFVRLAFDDPRVDSFPGPQPRAPERFRVQPEPGKMTFVFPVPFAPEFHLALGPNGTYWTGVSDAYRIYEVSLESDTTRIVEREFEPPAVTASDIEAALDHDQVDHIRSVGGEVDLDRIPVTQPAFEWLTVDDEGHLWVARSAAEGGQTAYLDVFDPDGRHLGQVRIPESLLPEPRPVVQGNRLWGVTKDELDVEYVVGFRIHGR